MAKLRLNLLGEPRVTGGDGTCLRPPKRKSLALLVYLASPPGVARSRDHLASLLWSRSAEEQARTSLRQNLALLRKSLDGGRDAVVADARQIEQASDLAETDVAEFLKLAGGSDVAAPGPRCGLPRS